MRIFEVMSARVHTVQPTDSAESAWNLMHTKGVRHVVVKNGEGVVGMLSDSDAGGRSGGALRAGKTVGDLMDRHVIAVDTEDTVKKAANLMGGHLVGCLPVIHRGKLVGVVTTTDLLKLIGRGVDRPNQPTRAAMHYKVPHRKNGAAGRW